MAGKGDSPEKAYARGKRERNLELKLVLVLVRNDLIAVLAILLSLFIVSFVASFGMDVFQITGVSRSIFHAIHEGVALTLLLFLGVRTIDHFVGGYMTRILKRVFGPLWRGEE